MRFFLHLLNCLLAPWARLGPPSTPPASTPAREVPDFIDPDPLRQMESELHFTNATYPHVIAHFNRCYRLPAAGEKNGLRPD